MVEGAEIPGKAGYWWLSAGFCLHLYRTAIKNFVCPDSKAGVFYVWKTFFSPFPPIFHRFQLFLSSDRCTFVFIQPLSSIFFVGERVLFLQDLFCIFTSAVAFFLKTSKSISIWAASYRFPFIHPSFHKLWGKLKKKLEKKERRPNTGSNDFFHQCVFFFLGKPTTDWKLAFFLNSVRIKKIKNAARYSNYSKNRCLQKLSGGWEGCFQIKSRIRQF